MFSKSDRNAKTSAKERSMRMVFSNSSITPPSEVSIKEAALFVLLSAAHQNAIDDEDGKGDGKAAVASSIQGRDGRAEDDQLDPQPYKWHGHRGAGRREQPPEHSREKRRTEPQRRLGDWATACPHAPVTECRQSAYFQ